MLSEYGVVESWRRLRSDDTSGWTDLAMNKLLDHSLEATVVESIEFRGLFRPTEIEQMESDLRSAEYKPKTPK